LPAETLGIVTTTEKVPLGSACTLSVSVSEEGDLHYSALIGRSTAYGTEAFYSEVPRVILELINRINIA